MVHGLSCSAACGVFPDQGSNPCPLRWQADSYPLTTRGVLALCPSFLAETQPHGLASASPASSPTGTVPRLFSWQRQRSEVKGTPKAKRPGQETRSWVSQGRLSPLHSRGTTAQPCPSQGLLRPRGSAMAGLPGSKVSWDRAWPGRSHLLGAVGGVEWEPPTPASAPTKPHPCSHHQPLAT